MNLWTLYVGTPIRRHADQGWNFQTDFIKELCSLLENNQSMMSSYQESRK